MDSNTEFDITEQFRQRGITRIVKENNTIVVVYNDNPIRCTIYDDYYKTIKSFEKNSKYLIQDKVLKQQIILTISRNWQKIYDEILNTNTDDQQDNNKKDIEKLDIPFEDWQKELSIKYDNLKSVIKENIPELLTPLEFSLSVKNILHISKCTLPFAGIILGRPSSNKTLGLQLLRNSRNTHYSDSFSAKSFVSHNTSVPKEQLKEIDLLPKIKDKVFLSGELSPIFSKKDDDLIEILGILTRVLDGHGYESDSGAHGHRGYTGEYMFTMLGAAVDIPRKVYRHLSSLGPKLYFLRTSTNEKTEDHYLKILKKDNFTEKFNQIQNLLTDYLSYFESCPIMSVKDDVPKIDWNEQSDDENALKIIVKLGLLLAHLRAGVNTWETKGTQGSDYSYDMPHIEYPTRAMTQLRNLAKGHALIQGRNYIIKEDVPILIKVVLSTASIERVSLFDLLLAHNEILTTDLIVESLGVSTPTALRTMTELKVIELVHMKQNNNTSEFEIQLREEFKWFLTEEFQKLREDFQPEDNSEYLKDKEKLPPTESNFSTSSVDDESNQLENNDKEQEKIEESEDIPIEDILKCPWCNFETRELNFGTVEMEMEMHLLDEHINKLNSLKIDISDEVRRAEYIIKNLKSNNTHFEFTELTEEKNPFTIC